MNELQNRLAAIIERRLTDMVGSLPGDAYRQTVEAM